MDPTILKPYFSPSVISEIEDFTRWVAKGNAYSSETVSPFLASSNLCLKQLDWMIVPWKLDLYLTIFAGITLNLGSMKFSVLIGWCCVSPSLHFILGFASWALWSIHPLEKVVSEPLEQSFELVFARHLLYLLWHTAECDAFCDLVVVKICHFDFALNPKCKLLLVDHVAFVFCVQLIKQLGSHVSLKLDLEGWQIVPRLFADDRCVCFVVEELELATTHLATLTRELVVKEPRLLLWASGKLGILLTILSTWLAKQMSLGVKGWLLNLL